MNLDLLNSVALAVAQVQNLDTVIKMIVQGIARQPDVVLVSLWFVKPGDICSECYFRAKCPDQTLCLHLVASAGNPNVNGEEWFGLNGTFRRIPLGVGKLGMIANIGESCLIPDFNADQGWVFGPDWVNREAIRSFVGHPLKFRDKAVGVLGVFSRDILTQNEFIWLRTFADQAAVAISNARAFEELEQLRRKLELENEYLQTEIKENFDFGDIVGQSPALKKLLHQIDLVAGTNATVLILGESGTGKELVARALHERSLRKGRPLIKVNCAAIPDQLFESEFFGHVRGAFTGANKDRIGRIQVAEGATLFLDEIGEVPHALQAKLLQVLQEQKYERVGENRTRTADVRIIAATNRDLKKEVESGRFRDDLYYRLSVFPIEIPPLRERKEDIPLLARHFVNTCAKQMSTKPATLTIDNMERLLAYDWPGNIRELQNVIERAVIFNRTGKLKFKMNGPESPRMRVSVGNLAFSQDSEPVIMTKSELKRRERESIIAALERTNRKISGPRGAAELLGMKPTTLISRIKALGLDINRSSEQNQK